MSKGQKQRQKRKYGDGSLYYEASRGKWKASFPIHGKEVFKRFATEEEGERWLTEQMYLRNKNQLVAPDKLTVEQWIEKWITDYKDTREQKTRETYRLYLRLHIKPYIGDVKLQELRSDILRGYFNQLQKKLSKGYVSKIYTLLRDALNQATINEPPLIPKNPILSITVEKPIKTPVHIILDDEEAKAVIDAAYDFIQAKSANKSMYAFVVLALNTGARLGELLAITWKDILYSGKRQAFLLRINKAVKETKELGVIIGDTKSHRERYIPLNETCMQALKELDVLQRKHIAKKGRSYNDAGLVFASQVGTIRVKNNIRRSFNTILKRANLECRIHDLRHTFATKIVNNTGDIELARQTLGHAQLQTTQGYIGEMPTKQKEAVDDIGKSFRRSTAI